jgi:hypothetical protein
MCMWVRGRGRAMGGKIDMQPGEGGLALAGWWV